MRTKKQCARLVNKVVDNFTRLMEIPSGGSFIFVAN